MANIDKGLYAAPQGIDALASQEPDLEISIEDPESVEIGMDGLTVVLEPGAETADEFDANLAEFMNEGDLTELSGDLLGEYESDEASRKDWLDTYVDGIELLCMKI